MPVASWGMRARLASWGMRSLSRTTLSKRRLAPHVLLGSRVPAADRTRRATEVVLLAPVGPRPEAPVLVAAASFLDAIIDIIIMLSVSEEAMWRSSLCETWTTSWYGR